MKLYRILFGFLFIAGTAFSQLVTTNDVVLDANFNYVLASGGAVGANPSASVGLSAVNGVATTWMRSDAAPALDQTIAPTMSGAWIFSNAAPISLTNAATGGIRIYDAAIDLSNYARLEIFDSSGTFNVRTAWAGTGTSKILQFTAGSSGGAILALRNAGTGNGQLRLSGNGNGSTGAVTFAIDTGTQTQTTGTASGISYTSTINQTSAGNFTDFIINRTETAVPNTQLFADFQVSASSKFSVNNKGTVTLFHEITNGTAPTIAAGTGAGTSPTISITGHDGAFTITLTTGTTPTLSATVCTVTFNAAYGVTPHFSLTPSNANASLLSGVSMVTPSATTTTFVLTAGATALTTATTYTWEVLIVQ